jgi:beta-galactosidase GanA
MLRTIAQEYKFNIIRIYSPWVYHNPEPDRFDFEELDEVMGYCDEFSLRVLMGVITEDAPYWLEAAHPETRYVNAKDQAQKLDGSGNNVSGGWPGLCLDWVPVREAAGKFIREMAKVVAAHRSMYAYDCWNEPHIEPAWGHHFSETTDELLFCYCSQTTAEFQGWLERRYGTLDSLNEAWVRRYPSWKVIMPPRFRGTYLDWLDWRRFIIEQSTNEMRFRVDNVRAVDSRHILESHGPHHPPVEATAIMGTNGWRLAEVVGTWGLSLFPRLFGLPAYVGASKLEITRSNAGGKGFWMTELQGGHGSDGLLWRGPKMRAQDIRFWNWLAVTYGAKGILYWTYHTEATGTEATGFGLVARDGSPTERVLEAADDNRLIQAHRDIIQDHLPKPEVAILFDHDNALLTFAMSGEESVSTDSFLGYYKALWSSDLWADFIEPSSLARASYKVIIAPWHLIGKRETCEHLQRFVEGGGTLILETAFGLFDENCFNNPVVPPNGLAESFGFREKESYYMRVAGESHWPVALEKVAPSERIYFEPEIEFSEPVPVRVKAHTFLTPIEISSATPIAKYRDFSVAATKKVDKGQVYYFGTNLGARIEAGDKGGIELLRTIVRRVVRPAVTADTVRPRLIEGPRRSLLVAFNDTMEDQTTTLALPPRYRRATDIYRNEELPIKENSVRIDVPSESVLVVRLE